MNKLIIILNLFALVNITIYSSNKKNIAEDWKLELANIKLAISNYKRALTLDDIMRLSLKIYLIKEKLNESKVDLDEKFLVIEKDILRKIDLFINEIKIQAYSFENNLGFSEVSYVTASNPVSAYSEMGIFPFTKYKSQCSKSNFKALTKAYSTLDLIKYAEYVAITILNYEQKHINKYLKKLIDHINSNKEYARFRPELPLYYKYINEFSSFNIDQNKQDQVDQLFTRNGMLKKSMRRYVMKMGKKGKKCFRFPIDNLLNKINDQGFKEWLELIKSKISKMIKNKNVPSRLLDVKMSEIYDEKKSNFFKEKVYISFLQEKLYLKLKENKKTLFFLKIPKGFEYHDYIKLDFDISLTNVIQPINRIIKKSFIRRVIQDHGKCFGLTKSSGIELWQKLKLKDNDCITFINGRRMLDLTLMYKFIEEIKLKNATDGSILLFRDFNKYLFSYNLSNN